MDFDKLRAVVDVSPLGASIYSVTSDQRVYSNKKTLEYFGADSEAQFNAVPARELFVDPQQALIVDEHSDNVTAAPRRELRKRLDGSYWISRTTRQRITLNDDDVFLIWYEDITELEGSSERFERVFNMPTVPMAMYRVSDRKWIDYNDSFRVLFGYEEAEFDELTWVEITHPDDLEVNESFFQKASDQHAMDSYTLKKRFIHKNGSVIYSRIHAEHIRDVGGTSKYVILVVHDLTEDVERERVIDAQRRDLANQLEQTVKAQEQIEKHAAEVAELAERESTLRIAAEAAEQTKSEFLGSELINH